MPHLNFKNEQAGIVQAMIDYPSTAKPLNELAQLLLQTDEELSKGERELIAAHVSARNETFFCVNSHLNASLTHFGMEHRLVDPATADVTKGMKIRPVMKALLNIASKVQQDGKKVTTSDIQQARDLGATDRMIHDTVLIAAAFCLYNRYVDGLATLSPAIPELYAGIGQRLANHGYLNAVPAVGAMLEQ